jgi:hypothetical protein
MPFMVILIYGLLNVVNNDDMTAMRICEATREKLSRNVAGSSPDEVDFFKLT